LEDGRQGQEEGNILYSGTDDKRSRYKLNADRCSVKEVQIFEGIKALLEGLYVFKKYATQTVLKERAFDPLQAHLLPPESCGYGKRLMSYNPSTGKLEFRVLKKPQVADHVIPLLDLKRLIIPKETSQIIKAQKLAGSLTSADFRSDDLLASREEGAKGEAPARLDKLGRNELNEAFREQCSTVRFYPFSLLTKDKRLEIVAETYTIFKYSTQALNQLIQSQAAIKTLKQQIIAIPQEQPQIPEPALQDPPPAV
jgi:hypothetical protein